MSLLVRPEGSLPLDWSAIFGTDAPVTLEIGFGNGVQLLERARKGGLHVGIELSSHSVKKALKRFRGLENVRLLWGDARLLLLVFGKASLGESFILYPDPWPKERHIPRRLFTQAFLDRMAYRTREGGSLTLATDHNPTFQGALASAASWRERPAPAPPLTKYGALWRGEGRELYAVTLEKAGPGEKGPEVTAMPHARTENMPGEEVLLSLLKRPQRTRGAVVVYTSAFRAVGGEGFLVGAAVTEEGVTQRFYLSVLPRKTGGVVQMADGSGAIGTPGAVEAVKTLARLLSG